MIGIFDSDVKDSEVSSSCCIRPADVDEDVSPRLGYF